MGDSDVDSEVEEVTPKAVHLADLGTIQAVCTKGVHRAYMFMGLGVNAADRDDLLEYHIAGFQQVQMMGDLPKEQVLEAKRHFRQWIIGNGLTELLHHYSTFLDRTYNLCLTIEVVRGYADQQKNQGRLSQFLNKSSIAGKSLTLEKEMKIVGVLGPYIHGWNRLRNCLVHASGLVHGRDCTDGDELVVKWRAMNVFIRNEDGDRPVVPMERVEKGGNIMMRFVEKERRFKAGTVVELRPIEIHEMCFFVHQDSGEVMKTALEFAKAHGVAIRQRQ